MTRFQKELFSEKLDEVVKICDGLLRYPEDIPPGWEESVRDMRIRAGQMAEKWRQVK